ncbi:MAG TPA: hypothetical protein VMT85_10520 [Thermoanaerobaculia bacterium]|nr:hypothetical protein [Thermoanaerobaculia bacterium]
MSPIHEDPDAPPRSAPAEPEPHSHRAIVCCVAAALALAGAASADWALREVVDPRSGDIRSAPGTRNAEGFQLDLLREDSGEVVAFFRLPPGEQDFLDATKPPIVSVDGGPEHAVLLREGGLTWAAFPVWNGQGDAATGLLRDLMQAETVEARSIEITYFLHGGGYKSTELALAGAAPVLTAAFGIPERLSVEQIARASELEAAIQEEGARCLELKGRKRERCLEAARACIETAASAAQLRKCVAAAPAR